MRDTAIAYPELWLSVYVSGPPNDAQGFAEMFARARCYKADKPEKADLVVFTGGSDVDPILYTDAYAHFSVIKDESRDKADIELYAKCYEEGIPMFGVCRGAQFGHVMNGGQLYMDINGHNSGQHQMYTNDGVIPVSSVHHQSCIQQPGMDLIGWGSLSTHRMVTGTCSESGPTRDVEAFFYRDTCFFGVQGHPEYKGFHAFTMWTLQKIEDLIVNNPDVVSNGPTKLYRIKSEFLAERENNSKKVGEAN